MKRRSKAGGAAGHLPALNKAAHAASVQAAYLVPCGHVGLMFTWAIKL
jgi:hypothetical protein